MEKQQKKKKGSRASPLGSAQLRWRGQLGRGWRCEWAAGAHPAQQADRAVPARAPPEPRAAAAAARWHAGHRRRAALGEGAEEGRRRRADPAGTVRWSGAEIPSGGGSELHGGREL